MTGDVVNELGRLLVALITASIPLLLALVLGLGGLLRLFNALISKPHPDRPTEFVSSMAMLIGSAYLIYVVELAARLFGVIR